MPLPPFEHLLSLGGEGTTPLEARVLSSPYGTPAQRTTLPFAFGQVEAVLRAVERPTPDPADLPTLSALGWAQEGQWAMPRGELLRRVGMRLYDALFPPGPVRTTLAVALARAREMRSPLPLQLHLDREAGYLGRLPWELACDEQGYLVQGGRMALARYLDFPAPPTATALNGALKVLVIVSRPTDLPALNEEAELQALRDSLAALNERRGLEVYLLQPATWREFVDAVSSERFHIVHFDGHGDFGRRCPRCRRVISVPATTCRAGCGANLLGIAPQGHLAFQRADGTADWRSPENLAAALFRSSELRLAVLSACRSGAVGKGSLFAGLGPALIGLGVPAVVAMQAEVSLEATTAFAGAFYGALAAGQSLLDATAIARAQLDEEAWFRPALYLRSKGDARGTLLGN